MTHCVRLYTQLHQGTLLTFHLILHPLTSFVPLSVFPSSSLPSPQPPFLSIKHLRNVISSKVFSLPHSDHAFNPTHAYSYTPFPNNPPTHTQHAHTHTQHAHTHTLTHTHADIHTHTHSYTQFFYTTLLCV